MPPPPASTSPNFSATTRAASFLSQSVTQAYVAAVAAREQVQVLLASAGALRREADIAAARFRAGDVSASDQSQIEIAAEQDELSAESEGATAKTAVVTLEIFLGEPKPEGTTPLADNLGQLAKIAAPDLDNMPVGSRPDVAAAEQAVGQAESNVTLQEAATSAGCHGQRPIRAGAPGYAQYRRSWPLAPAADLEPE